MVYIFILIMVMLTCFVFLNKRKTQGLLLLLISCLFCLCSCDNKKGKFESLYSSNLSTDSVVFICSGSSAKKYHKSRYCRWLKNCGGKIEVLLINEAKQLGKEPCKGCYKEK